MNSRTVLCELQEGLLIVLGFGCVLLRADRLSLFISVCNHVTAISLLITLRWCDNDFDRLQSLFGSVMWKVHSACITVIGMRTHISWVGRDEMVANHIDLSLSFQ